MANDTYKYDATEFGEGTRYLDEFSLEEQKYWNTYEACPPPCIPNPVTLDTDDFSRYYFISSTPGEAPTSEVMDYILKVSEALSTKGFKYRFGCNTKDTIAASVYSALPPMKCEVYKPFTNNKQPFAPEFTKNVIDETASFASQAILAAVYNRYAKELGFKPSSGFKQAEDEINSDYTISAEEKQMRLVKKKAELAANKPKSAMFSTLAPGKRSMRATISKLVFGGGEYNVPVKFIIIHSEIEHTKVKDLNMEVRGNKVSELAFAEYFRIPIFNIAKEEGRKKLDTYLKTSGYIA